MSYILDALKKSEQKRQKGQVPDLNTPQTEPPREEKKKPSWPLLLAGILLLNVIILAVVIMRPDQSVKETEPALQETQHKQLTPDIEKKDESYTQKNQELLPAPLNLPIAPSTDVGKDSTSASTQTTAATEPDAEHDAVQTALATDNTVIIEDKTMQLPSSQAVNIKTETLQAEKIVLEQEAIMQDENNENFIVEEGGETEEESFTDLENQDIETGEDNEPLADFSEEDAPSTETDMEQEATRRTQPLADAIQTERTTPRKEPLHILQLPSAVQQQLPEIRIGAHFYSKTPKSRLASVNGKILREGHTLSKDLKVDEITPDGVNFSYQKYLFHVPVF